MRVDLAVVGGGPAGAAAAYWAARAGLDVLILEKAAFPRDKTCGDGLTGTALREVAAMGIDLRPHAQPVRRTELYAPYGYHVELPMEAGLRPGALLCGVVRRAHLDPMLVEAATAAGAKLEERVALEGLEYSADGARATVSRGGTRTVVEAAWVVGADGAYSRVRALTFPTDAGRMPGMHAVRQYVDAPESDLLSVYFPAELLPGYAWAFPVPGGGVNIGLGIQRAEEDSGTVCREHFSRQHGRYRAGALGNAYRELLRRPEVVERLGQVDSEAAPLRAWPIPSDPDLSHLAARRALLVGDAARVADPMTGEGIGQALLTGRLAAEAVTSASVPTSVPALYRRAVERELGHDLRFARFLLRAMRHRRGVEWAFKIAGTSAWTRRNVARWMYEDYPRAYVLTPGRWGRFGMRGVGAYGGVPLPGGD